MRGHPTQHYVRYEGPSAVSLRQAYHAWRSSRQPMASALRELPRPNEGLANAVKECISLTLQTPVLKQVQHFRHGNIRAVYRGWRLAGCDPEFYNHVRSGDEWSVGESPALPGLLACCSSSSTQWVIRVLGSWAAACLMLQQEEEVASKAYIGRRQQLLRTARPVRFVVVKCCG